MLCQRCIIIKNVEIEMDELIIHKFPEHKSSYDA
jgi:hypothetical protein